MFTVAPLLSTLLLPALLAAGRLAQDAAPVPHQDPVATPTATAPLDRATVARDLAALLPRGATLALALEAAREAGRAVLVVATADPAPADGGLSFQQLGVAGVLLADPRVRERIESDFIVLARALAPGAVQAGVVEAIRAAPGGSRPAASLELDRLGSPALAVLDSGGRVERAWVGALPADAGAVAAWLLPAGGRDTVARIDVSAGDAAGQVYLALARAPLAEQPERATAFLEAHGSSPWALKARARAAFPRAVAAYERLRAGATSPARAELVQGARLLLRETQQADGSFPAGEACPAAVVTTLAASALHAAGDHDAAQRALEWLAARRDEVAVDPLLLAFLLDAHVSRFFAGWSRAEEVSAAAARLVELQGADGGWAAGAAFAGAWRRASPGASSVHTGFALDALLRARAAGVAVDEGALARGAAALEALRGPDGVYVDLLPSPLAGVSGGTEAELAPDAPGSRGLTLPADGALLQLERLRTRDVVVAIEAFLDELPSLRGAAGAGGVGDRPPAATGELVGLAFLGYVRGSNAITDRRMTKRDARVLRAIVHDVRGDGCWVDAPEQGWPVATALRIVALSALR